MSKLTSKQISQFHQTVYDHYLKNGRHTLPWRHTTDPYKILVSEVMLQQTQVDRVILKYKEFIKRFPNFKTLAAAPTSAVLTLWSGLGYNRRALYLHRTAKTVALGMGGVFPHLPTVSELVQLPGIGPNTAGAILAYAFNAPVVFIETNIRSVFIHHFFKSQSVSDAQLLPLIQQTLDTKNPRLWYWALMDYGVFLKKQFKNPSRRSAHHTKQSKFEGSNRQMRGAVLKALLNSTASPAALAKTLKKPWAALRPVVARLLAEGFIKKSKRGFTLA